MSLENIVRSVSGRLSLREPQAESLRRLHWAVDAVPALRNAKARSAEELKSMLEALQGQFPTLTDFERDFPSMCFALATGVGKTRLMGAFISYLHAAYGYRHFFVLAPNLTIYDKLIGDFSPGSPKYVFKPGYFTTPIYPPPKPHKTTRKRRMLANLSIKWARRLILGAIPPTPGFVVMPGAHS